MAKRTKHKTKDKLIAVISSTTVYPPGEVSKAFDLLKSYDAVIYAAHLSVWCGVGLIDVVERMCIAINDL